MIVIFLQSALLKKLVRRGLDEAPEGTFETIMRSVLSIAQNSGLESVDVHAPDPDGRNAGLCYRMGFEDSGPCTCCQRTDLIHMAFRF